MNKIEFSVGAKAARLIGRENIADVDGAMMELIKNSYDADASCVFVKFSIPFPDSPKKANISDFSEVLSSNDFIKAKSFYNEQRDGTLKKKDLDEDESKELSNILFKYNKIIIADNGSGMSRDIVTSSWMYIGTSDKENNIFSAKGRVKTGAKGIGRFALDKLSKKTSMYTATCEKSGLINWTMDWDQFANAKFISDVSAEMNDIAITYKDMIEKNFAEYQNIIDTYNWSSGTLLILNPTREIWNKRLFTKLNTNLSSINPIGSVDPFDVIIKNEYFPELSYNTEKVSINESDYDYRIRISYDGLNLLKVQLKRNEIDLSAKYANVKAYDKIQQFSLDDFWSRDKFKKVNYHKNDYESEISYDYQIENVLPNDDFDHIKKVGSFNAEMYFMRLDASGSIDINKKFSAAKRKLLRKNFSGVKIYRDKFKVRPYGDDGSLFDWLGLGSRTQKSPAGVGNEHQLWRVEPYQLMGWVCIGRQNNPFLEDMANREGLALNEYYYLFRDLILKGIEDFEYDRQYIYREYTKWYKLKQQEMFSAASAIEHEAIERGQKVTNKSYSEYEDKTNEQKFTEEEFFGTVQNLLSEKEQSLNAKQMLQILSSSGIILNTFFHEFNAINTQFHVEASQIRSRINYILHNQKYTGLEAYNPYTRIDVLENNDKVIAAFLDVVMEGMKKGNLKTHKINFENEIDKIVEQWKVIMAQKHIFIDLSVANHNEKLDLFDISIIDLYIILNNFMLNSAWFLEHYHNKSRRIKIKVSENADDIEMILTNNGPKLDEKYRFNQDRIFELGESSKSSLDGSGENDSSENGTGLGLWILKETVERNNGIVEVIQMNDGFGLKITLKR